MATLRLGIDSRGAKKGADEFVQSTDRVRRESRTVVSTLRNVGARFVSLGSQASAAAKRVGGLFAGISSVIAARNAIREISSYESALVTLGAVSRATTAEQRLLNEVARETGSRTRFSATQSAEGLLFLARAGFEVREQIAALPATLNLAQVGLLELGESADIASNVVSQFGLEASRTNEVVDSLIIVSNRANTDVRQLAEALVYAGTVSASLGNSVQTTSAALGVLGDRGIQASKAGTNLRGVQAALLEENDKLLRVLARLDIAYDDVNPEEKGLIEIFERFNRAGLGASDAVSLFGRRNAAAALILSDSTDRMRELVSATEEFKGEAEEIAQRQAQTLIGRFKAMTSALSEAALASGDRGLLGGLKNLVTGFTNLIRFATTGSEALRDLDADSKTLAVSLAAVFAPFGLPLKLAGAALYGLRNRFVEVNGSVISLKDLVSIAWDVIAGNTEELGTRIKLVWADVTSLGKIAILEIQDAWDKGITQLQKSAIGLEVLIPEGFGGRSFDELEADRAVIQGRELNRQRDKQAAILKANEEFNRLSAELSRIQANNVDLADQFFNKIQETGDENRETMRQINVATKAATLAIVGFLGGQGTPVEQAATSETGTKKTLEQINAELAKVPEVETEKPFEKMSRSAKDANEETAKLGQSVSDSLRSGLEEAVLDFENLESVAKAVFEEIRRAAIRAQIAKALGTGNFFGPDTGGVGKQGSPGAGQDIGTLGSPFAQAFGNVFRDGRIVPFQFGGILNRPTYFPLAGGNTGVAGENGEEGVLPLARTSKGKLGVETTGQQRPINVTMNISGVSDADSFRRSRRQIQSSMRNALRS